MIFHSGADSFSFIYGSHEYHGAISIRRALACPRNVSTRTRYGECVCTTTTTTIDYDDYYDYYDDDDYFCFSSWQFSYVMESMFPTPQPLRQHNFTQRLPSRSQACSQETQALNPSAVKTRVPKPLFWFPNPNPNLPSIDSQRPFRTGRVRRRRGRKQHLNAEHHRKWGLVLISCFDWT